MLKLSIKLTSLLMSGFIAQLVEHRTGIRGGYGPNCLNWQINCDDHSSLGPTHTVLRSFGVMVTNYSKGRREKRMLDTFTSCQPAPLI